MPITSKNCTQFKFGPFKVVNWCSDALLQAPLWQNSDTAAEFHFGEGEEVTGLKLGAHLRKGWQECYWCPSNHWCSWKGICQKYFRKTCVQRIMVNGKWICIALL